MGNLETSQNSVKGWAHFIAVGGTGMGALASMLKELGYVVTGSDGPLYPPMSDFLDSKNILRHESYSPDNLNGKKWGLDKESPDLIVIGNAISRTNLEAQAAEELFAKNVSKKFSFAQALAEFCIRDRESYVVCGTHGKTSTTTQLAWALETLKQSPGFFIGGIPGNFDQGCLMGMGDCFVSEGDEYDTAYWDKESKFLHYRPSWVLCTGIEFDHVDIYQNVEQIEVSFHKLISITERGWIVVDSVSAPRADTILRLEKALKEKQVQYQTYGRSETSAYRLVELSEELIDSELGIMGSVLNIHTPQWGRVSIRSPLSGEHNALNTLGIIAMLLESKKLENVDELQYYLDSFKGVKRRQEELHASKDIVLIDDFAHHPTAIRETIRAVRKKYIQHDLAAFFEPRSATSARNIFQQEFVDSFEGAHLVYLSPPTKTNVPNDQKLDVFEMQKKLEEKKIKTFVSSDVKDIENQFFSDLETSPPQSPAKGRVALIMSNGSFGGIHKNILRRVRSRSGQAAVEYILLLLVIVLIASAFLMPYIKEMWADIEEDIRGGTTNVLAQDTLGIPLAWFDLQSDDDLDVRYNKFAAGMEGMGAGSEFGQSDAPNNNMNRNPNANTDAGAADTQGDDNAAAGGDGPGGGAQGNNRNQADNSADRNRGGGGDNSGNNADRAGNREARDEGLGRGGESNITAADTDRGAGDSRFDGGAEGGGDGDSARNAEASGEEEEEDSSNADGDITRSQQQFDGREEERRKGGCEDVDLATLLKLLAIAGILVIGAIIVLSGRGGGKNAK